MSSFISINELIDHPVLDPSYLSIPDYVKLMLDKKPMPWGKLTPLQLADTLENNGKKVLGLISPLSSKVSTTLSSELDDLETWAYLSIYFAHKLRAGVALQTFRILKDTKQQENAVQLLTLCVADWKKISAITSRNYQEVPYLEGYRSGGNGYKDALRFSWVKFLPQVERDIQLAKQSKP